MANFGLWPWIDKSSYVSGRQESGRVLSHFVCCLQRDNAKEGVVVNLKHFYLISHRFCVTKVAAVYGRPFPLMYNCFVQNNE